MKEKVPADAFFALDIRVGRITGVEEFPEAKKNLYIVTADFGEAGSLKTAAGLRGIKTTEELTGTKIVGAVNLKPKQIGKHISQFLILAAKNDEGKPVLLQTESDVEEGAEIF
jgi:tRNA-binding protein